MRQGGGSRSQTDLLIVGKAYLSGRLVEAAIGVEGGKVVWVGKEALAPLAERKFEAGEGIIVLPGMVDMHVHMRDLGEVDKEDWYTGTLSALAGGVTFVADMPNTKPPARSLDVLKVKEEVASKKALVDYSFYAGLPDSAGELERMLDFGVVGLKLYPEDLHREDLATTLKAAAGRSALVVLHPEDPLILQALLQLEEHSLYGHSKLRPPEAEEAAIRYLSLISRKLGLRLHFTHVSSRRGLLQALREKLRSAATVDTAIHYLFLDESFVNRLGGIAKVNPPLRSAEDVAALRRAARGGALNAVITDHAPHRLEEKLRERYKDVLPGFPGLELCLPLLFSLIAKGELPLKAVDLYSSEPASILGAPKGTLAPGADADVIFLDVRERWVVRGQSLRSKAKYTPFEGFEAVGRVRKVFVRGVLAYDDGEVMVSGGFGRRYRPSH